MKVKQCLPTDDAFQSIKERLYSDVPWSTVPDPVAENLECCFVVLEQGQTICQAALFTGDGIRVENKKYATVGSFESDDNPKAVQVLMEAISAKAKQLGFDGLIGPMNGSTWQAYRFNAEQYTPFFTEFFHPEYYPRLWEQGGFEKFAGYFSSIAENVQERPTPAWEVPEGITVRTIDLENYEEELLKIHRFCTEAFSQNFLFSAISQSEFLKLYLPLKAVLDPEFVFIAEEDGEMVCLMLNVPDHYSKTEKRLITKTIARKAGKRYAGLGHQVSNMLLEKAKAYGYHTLIYAFVLDDGMARQLAKDFFGEVFREYNLYKMDL